MTFEGKCIEKYPAKLKFVVSETLLTILKNKIFLNNDIFTINQNK